VTDAHTLPKLPLAQLDATSFHRNYVRPKRPVHLADTISTWGARRWTEASLRALLGSKIVKVSHSRKSTFDYNVGSSADAPIRKLMPFAEALALIYSEQGGSYYIAQQNMQKEFPELLPDVGRPALLNEWKIVDVTNLWIGGKGCKTPLHFDANDNFLVQVGGTKRVTLFPPEQSANLYPALGDLLEHCSRVNVFAPDRDAFPLFAQAEAYRIELRLDAGDTLYIPAKWWHAVETLEASISINFWWRALT